MGFLSSIFKRRSAAAAASEPVDELQRARRRARQRLIGATVLLAIGVVGFPLVFETQPRPIPVDIPIEIPRKDGLPPLVAPASRQLAATPAPPVPSEGTNPQPQAASSGPPPAEMITESREDAGRDGVSTPSSPPRGTEPGASKPAATVKPTTRTGSPPRPDPALLAGKPDAGDDGARARALLDGKASGAASDAAGAAARFIVQVGAFADANAAHETRLKIEKLGMKTYTQVASTPAGSRIRVRVGPFPSRDEADKALAKARSAGLSAVMLTL